MFVFVLACFCSCLCCWLWACARVGLWVRGLAGLRACGFVRACACACVRKRSLLAQNACWKLAQCVRMARALRNNCHKNRKTQPAVRLQRLAGPMWHPRQELQRRAPLAPQPRGTAQGDPGSEHRREGGGQQPQPGHWLQTAVHGRMSGSPWDWGGLESFWGHVRFHVRVGTWEAA